MNADDYIAIWIAAVFLGAFFLKGVKDNGIKEAARVVFVFIGGGIGILAICALVVLAFVAAGRLSIFIGLPAWTPIALYFLWFIASAYAHDRKIEKYHEKNRAGLKTRRERA